MYCNCTIEPLEPSYVKGLWLALSMVTFQLVIDKEVHTLRAALFIVSFHWTPPATLLPINTYGTPWSPPELTPDTSGSSPRMGNPRCAATLWNLSGEPYKWCGAVHDGQMKWDWFSKIPVILNVIKLVRKMSRFEWNGTYWHSNFSEHRDSSPYIRKSNILGCRYNDGAYQIWSN